MRPNSLGKYILNKAIFYCITTCFVALGCLGKGDDVRTRKDMPDGLPAYLVHAVGEDKINALLHNPLDAVSPGLFIDDMLYLLANSDKEKLVRFVRDVSTQRIIRLIYNIKRMGCNRVNPALDILFPPSYARCTLDIYNHLDILVRMINGTDNVAQLIQIVNQESFGTPASTMEAYLEKLAYFIVYIGSVDKVFDLLNGIIDTRDVIFFIDRLDPALNGVGMVPASIAEIQSGTKLGDMDSIMRILGGLTDGNKIYELLNGVRPLGGNDVEQQGYLINLTDMLVAIDTEAGQLCPADAAVTATIALINNLTNAVSLVRLIQELNPVNTAGLINATARRSQHTIALNETEQVLLPPSLPVSAGNVGCDEITRPRDKNAGGIKLAGILNQVTETKDVIFLISQLSNGITTLSELIGRLNVTDAYKLGQLLNDVTPAFNAAATPWTSQPRYYYNPTPPNRRSSTGIGKVINLLNGLDAGGSLVKLINNITDGAKLPTLLNNATDSSNLTGFLNAILREPTTTFDDLVDFINAMSLSEGIPRVVQLVDELAAATETATVIDPSAAHQDIAALMAPQAGDVMADTYSGGIGTTAMALLLNGLGSTVAGDGSTPVKRLIQIINNTNLTFAYNNATPNIPRKEALVRLMTFGVRYNPAGFNYQFPAFGVGHMATLINNVGTASLLYNLLNSTTPYVNIADVVPTIACGDRIGIVNPPHYIAYSSGAINFQTHCSSVNMGW